MPRRCQSKHLTSNPAMRWKAGGSGPVKGCPSCVASGHWIYDVGVYGGAPPEAKGETIVTRLLRGIRLSGDLKAIAPRSSKYAVGHPRQSAFRQDTRATGAYLPGTFCAAVMFHHGQRGACFVRRLMPARALRQHSRSTEHHEGCLFGNMNGTHNFDLAGFTL